MRYAVLLMLGAFGIFLLFAARYRYQAVNTQLASFGTVEGIVDSIGPEGELDVKYQVDGTAIEIVRPVPFNIPRIRKGDQVTLVYDPARPDTARVRQWSVLYPDSAIAGGFGVIVLFFALGGFWAMGSVPSRGSQPYSAHKFESSKPVVTSLDSPIELRNARDEFYISFLMAGAAFAAAYAVYRHPEILWARWMVYPMTGLIALFGVGMIFAAFQNQTLRIRASHDGLETEDSSGARKFLWKDVAALKRITKTRSVWQSGRHFRRGYTSTVLGRYLIMLDSSGAELLRLDEDVAMEPAQDWLRLRRYIPERTGLAVEEETRESLL